ncbi:hypothetical protein F5Y07DRAFT_370242 [Xylaria sp. FL0933]|nr:hypothetical protein F5Y07DRAFT_370242 [Xylaria sp. FL0933]
MANLLNIPLEVLLQITSHLTTPEYGYLRRTCKQIEALLFGAFAREFFSKRQFALLEFSIQALVDIAKSRLGPSLTHLIIHLEHPDYHASPGGDDTYVRWNQYHAESAKHWEFIRTGLDVEMLSEALSHLPNLETIGMRDFYSKTRRRDGTAWNSYGCPTLRAKTDMNLVIPRPDTGVFRRSDTSEYTNHVFLTILRVMGHAAVSGWNPKLTRMEVLLHFCGMRDQSFKIPDRFDTAISLALSKLTTIFLDNLSQERTYFWARDVDGRADPVASLGYFLSRFLTRASALDHLRLNLQSYSTRAAGDFLLWLAGARTDSTDPMQKPEESLASANDTGSLPALFPPAPEFPRLKTIEIGMATVEPLVLLTLYKRYKATLEGVSLHKVALSPWSPNAKSNALARLCNSMADADLQLRSVMLSYIHQKMPASNIDITFRESRNPHVKIWKGSTFVQSVKDITDEMVFHYVSDDNASNSDSDDDDDDDGDEFMDDDDDEV